MFIITFFSSLFIACNETVDEKKTEKNTNPCDLSLDDLVNTNWVYEKNMGGSALVDPKFRLRFYSKEGKMKAQYNAGDMRAMYDYDCVSAPKKILCSTAPEPVDLCLSFFAANKKCTKKSLEKFYMKRLGIKGTDKKNTSLSISQEQMRQANIDAEQKIIAWKKEGVWENRYKLLYNSIRKRQMGLLYVEVNKSNNKCNLDISDNYAALSNAEILEDASGMIGRSNFEKHQGEMLWDSCTDTDNSLWLTDAATLPENMEELKAKAAIFIEEDAHFWILNEKLSAPMEKECTYDYEIWLNGQPFDKAMDNGNQKPVLAEDKKSTVWHYKTQFKTPNKDATDKNIIAFKVNKSCNSGPKEMVGNYCAIFQVAKRK